MATFEAIEQPDPFRVHYRDLVRQAVYEVVQERLRVYHAQTEPLIQYYRDKGVLTIFDGTQLPPSVFGVLMRTYREKIGSAKS